jgi:uncharacterized protein (TIGR04141 family)
MDLSLYLLRRDLDPDSWGLKSNRDVRGLHREYKEIQVKEIPGIDIRLLARPAELTPPRWRVDLLTLVPGEVLDAGDGDPLVGLQNQSAGAVLLIRRRDWKFLIVFGSGRFSVDQNAIEIGFGLKVVANKLDSGALLGADTRRMVGMGRSHRVSIPSSGSLDRLGVEPTLDLVRYLEGKPSGEFARGIAGGDVLRLSLSRFSFRQLPEKLDEIIEAYSSEGYKEAFPFLDYFVRVPASNENLYSKLRLEAERRILAGGRDVDFMIPDVDRNGVPEKFVLRSGRRKVTVGALSRDVVLSAVSEWGVVDPLVAIRVEAFYQGEPRSEKSSLLSYLVGDFEFEGRNFSPCAGAWYEVDADHLSNLNARIAQIPDLTNDLGLRPWRQNDEDEEAYNLSVLPRGETSVVLDKRLFYSKGGSNLKVEVCDLLTRQKELICIKKATDSATLSHLFAQGSVSARLFGGRPDYRRTVLDHLGGLGSSVSLGAYSDWTIVFAIASDRPGRLADSLYFFSKINLEAAVSAIRGGVGMRVALAKIDLV